MDASRVLLWIHGHTHDVFDYRVQGARVVCNPRGYAPDQLSEDFRADLVVRGFDSGAFTIVGAASWPRWFVPIMSNWSN